MRNQLNEGQKPELREAYRNFTPPAWVNNALSRLIERIPAEHLNGLNTISLADGGGLNRARRRRKTLSRKRKVAIQECRGLYHQKWQGQPARIELFIDNIIDDFPTWVLRLAFFQDILLADVLYHEIGHHIHKTSAPEHEEREDVAEDWRKRLSRIYFREQYWYLRPLAFILRPPMRLLRAVVRLIQKRSQSKEYPAAR